MPQKLIDLSGQVFGRLTVLSRGANVGARTRWHCICECGKKVTVDGGNLRGSTRSCGCYKRDLLHQRKQPSLLIQLNGMVRYYKRNAKLREVPWHLEHDYAISLFESACHYCGYSEGLCGIDRVNNDLGYFPKNCVPCCRWCNWGKNERTMAEFKDWVRRLHATLFYSR